MRLDFIRSLLKRPLYLLAPALALVLAAWAFWPRAIAVEMAPVARAPLTVSFSEEGKTRLRQRYRITAPVDGFLRRIAVEPGAAVHAGDQLAVLLPTSARLLDPATLASAEAQYRAAGQALAAAQASLDAARADGERRQKTLERVEALAARRLMSRADLDAARADASAGVAAQRAAAAAVEQARLLRDGARAALQLQGAQGAAAARQVPVRAPASGRVLQRFLDSEGPVQAGQALLEIGDPGDLEVEVEILSADAVRIAVGTRVQLTRWGGDAALPGRVRIIEPGAFTKVSALGVEEQRVRAIVAFEPSPTARARLGDGYRVEARFQVWHDDSVLQLPIAALFRDGQAWAVYAVENGRARLRRVSLGHFGDSSAELRGGLGEGAMLVLYPGDKVRDGRRVARQSSPR